MGKPTLVEIFDRVRQTIARAISYQGDWKDIGALNPLTNFFSPQGLREFADWLNEEFAEEGLNIEHNDMNDLEIVQDVSYLVDSKLP